MSEGKVDRSLNNPALVMKSSVTKLKPGSPTHERPPKIIENDEISPINLNLSKLEEMKRSKIEEIKRNSSKQRYKRKQVFRNASNCALVDIDPKVWKTNKTNCIPMIPYRGQEGDEFMLHLVKYIRWLFKIGKYNSMSSESGSISSLTLYRKRNSRLNKSNVSDNIDNVMDLALPEKILADFQELYV